MANPVRLHGVKGRGCLVSGTRAGHSHRITAARNQGTGPASIRYRNINNVREYRRTRWRTGYCPSL
jgi:hypothetical protein